MRYPDLTGRSGPAVVPPSPAADTELDIEDSLREEAEASPELTCDRSVAALTLGSVGVVYGDIATSPLDGFREALRPVAAGGAIAQEQLLGTLSLLIWTLVVVVTIKYVLFLLRLDNRGDGGILAFYTLVRLALGRRSLPVWAVALFGAASIRARQQRQSIPLDGFVRRMSESSHHVVTGNALFLGPEPDVVPSALRHRVAADPTDDFHLPRHRVVELGEWVAP